MSWTIDEWFVIARARTVRPRETVFHGFGSPSAQVAMHAATGFALEVAGDLRAVSLPSTAELATVRPVDPLKVRTSEFSRPELDRGFERGDGQDCAC